MASVLVTDGEERAALAIVRSLGRAGHDVYVCSSRNRSLAGASRHARAHAQVDGPLADPARYADRVRDLTRRWQVDTLLPVTEASLIAVLERRDAFSDVTIPFPDHDVFVAANDKRTVLGAAARLGIATPRQIVFVGPTSCADGGPSDVDYPVAIKPSRSVVPVGGHGAKMTVSYAADEAALTRRLAAFPETAFPVLVQEVIEGPGIGVFLLLWQGAVRAMFAHRRLRERPPWGGQSVLREGIEVDAGLLDRSRGLMESFGWQGVCMVEYKVRHETNVPYLMEVNGRFWGSLQLAIDSGVDFPALLVDCAHGIIPDPPKGYAVGLRSRWWWGDVDQLLMRLRAHSRNGWTPPARDSQQVGAFTVWPDRRNTLEIMRVTDPFPFVQETIDWFLRR